MVGTGGYDPHGSMMPVHDAETDRQMRQRDIRNVGPHLLALIIAATLMLAALGILSLVAIL